MNSQNISGKSTGRKRRRNKKKQQEKTTLLILCVFVFGITGCIAVYFYTANEYEKLRVSVSDSSGSDINEHSDKETLEEILRSKDIERLRRVLSEIDNDSSLELPIRLHNLDKKVAVCNRIMELDSDNDSPDNAAISKLDAMISRELIGLEHEIAGQYDTAELSLLADSFMGSQNSELSNLARVAISLGYVSRFLNSGHPSSRVKFKEVALEKFASLVTSFPDDFSVARKLFEFLPAIGTRTNDDSHQEFLLLLVDTYFDSKNSKIVRLVSSNYSSEQIANETGQFVEIIDIAPSERESAISALSGQIENWITSNGDSLDLSTQVFGRLNDLLALGQVSHVKMLRDKIGDVEGNKFSSSNQTRITILDRKIALFESPFDISALRDFEDESVDFQVANADYRLLYIVSEDNHRESIVLLNRLLRSIRHFRQDARVEIVVVILESAKKSDISSDIRKLAAKSSSMGLWFLNTGSEHGKEFLRKILPVTRFPFIIVLGGNHDVRFLGPPISRVAEIVSSE